ncbi:MAG: hypothetical protein L3J08_03500, partial [Flavobacteriaceae bacterium]|nr:hypothetical protein [Flavobacteriaceae bacterium]
YEGYYENLLAERGMYPKKFLNINTQDVTMEYNLASANIEIALDSEFNKDIAYLSVHNYNKWSASSWGKRNPKGLYEFNNIGCEIVYLPVSYNYLGIKAISNPFILKKNGTVKFLNPNHKKVRTIKIDRKYLVQNHMKRVLKKMIGGKFQGANFSDFRDAQDLYEITSVPVPKTNNFEITNQEQYRYFRFIHSNQRCRVAEISFFGTTTNSKGISNNNVRLDGKWISSKYLDDNGPDKIQDGKILTYFIADSLKGGWVGLDLGQRNGVRLTRVEFYPPNDGNSVEIGDSYELFYWESGWQSLGKQVAQKEELTFENCPENALFILRNYTKGEDERIFTFENNEQVWW